jgi:hypothetical protein
MIILRRASSEIIVASADRHDLPLQLTAKLYRLNLPPPLNDSPLILYNLQL